MFEYDDDQMLARVTVSEVPAKYADRVRQAAGECAPGAIVAEE